MGSKHLVFFLIFLYGFKVVIVVIVVVSCEHRWVKAQSNLVEDELEGSRTRAKMFPSGKASTGPKYFGQFVYEKNS